MCHKDQISSLKKEIRRIDKVLYVLLFFTLGQIVLTTLGYINLNLIPIFTIGGSIGLFRYHVRKRNSIEALMKLYEALDDPDAFEKKYLKK